MKHLQTFILAVTIMLCSAGSAAADQFEFNGPDIKGELDRMIEIKMNVLINKPTIDQRKSRAMKHWEIYLNNLRQKIS